MDRMLPDGRDDPGESIFFEAIDKPPSEREAFVRARCGDDTILQASVFERLRHFDQLGSFLNSPAIQPLARQAIIAPGTLLNRRFVVGEHLGQGGMGTVYRADDTVLGESVALKLIRDIWLDDSAMTARFREEIKLARKIAHPNVCKVYEIFSDTVAGREQLFFSMEYVQGQSLADMLRSGWRPSQAEVIEIVSGIAAGLDAAHRLGIVHRDMKPANVLLSREAEGRWKPTIMDFGLAQALASTRDPVTGTGQIAGSPDYMAPEQFLGDPVTQSADVFALAVITFEMATGARPWPDDANVIRSAMRRVSAPVTPVDCGRAFPRHWNVVLSRSLARDSKARPDGATQFFGMLESPGTRLMLLRNYPSISRRAILPTAAAGILASFYFLFRSRDKKLEPGKDPVLMIAPTESSGFEDVKALEFVMETQLRQSAHIQIADKEAVSAAWRRMNNGRETAPPRSLKASDARNVALLAGAHTVLFSSVSKTGDDYRLTLKLESLGQSTSYPAATVSKDFFSDERALMRATRDATVWLRRELDEMPADIAARSFPPEELTTGNWRALNEFLKAQELWTEEIHGRNADEAIRRLNTALDLDPDFARAAGRLGDLLAAVGQVDEGLRYQQKAIELMARRDLTDAQSLRIRGLYYQDTGQDEEAQKLFSLWADQYPKDGLPLFYKAKSVMQQGREEEAFALRRRAAELAPKDYALQFGAAQALLEAGDLDGAARAASRLPENGVTDRLLSSVAFGRYQVAEVQTHLERMRSRAAVPFQVQAHAMLACLHAEQARGTEAIAEAQAGVRAALENGQRPFIFSAKLLIAKLFLSEGKPADAERECRQLLDLKPGIKVTLEAGCVLARAGALPAAKACLATWSGAKKEAAGYLSTPIYTHWRKRLAAEIALGEGRPKSALAALADAPPPEVLDQWPEYAARTSLAAGDTKGASALMQKLLKNPGRYWFEAADIGPGVFRWASQQALNHNLLAPEDPALRKIQGMLKV